MTDTLVSVLMPVYNGAAFLEQALRSALAQTFCAFEVIVVDDGSSDASGEIADRFAREFTQVRVIHQANQGLCHARNAAIAVAQGQYLALLDADDVWYPHHLSASVARLSTSAAIGLVHANIQRLNARGDATAALPRFWTREAAADPFATIYLRREHVSCPTAVFRRDVVERVGAFDIAFNRLGCEDRDLWLRIAAVSDVVFLDDLHAQYRVHDANMSANLEKMHRARLLLIEKISQTPRGQALRRAALAAAQFSYGDSLADQGRRIGAIEAYARAFWQRPTDPRALKSVARMLLRPQADSAKSAPAAGQ